MEPVTQQPSGPLAGLRILEIAGIGPAPFAGMILADLGAEVILVQRPSNGADPLELGKHAIFNRGKKSICIDLKQPGALDIVLRLLGSCDALLEGMRPGTMERLGLGPEVCFAHQPRLVYGRMTGWGQTGPLAHAAGHDVNYAALSGAVWYAGQPGEAPLPPPTLVGDLGGGALYLVCGVLAGILHAKATGQGQVVDAAIVDGAANLMNLLLSLQAAGRMTETRGQGLLDGPYWYGTYRCSDGHFVSIGALEPKFNALLLDRLGLSDDPAFARPYDRHTWPEARERIAKLFATAPRAHWCELLEGTDACFAPVMKPSEAIKHPHLASRGVYQEREGLLQAASAPRFSSFPQGALAQIPDCGADSRDILHGAGFTAAEIFALLDTEVVFCQAKR